MSEHHPKDAAQDNFPPVHDYESLLYSAYVLANQFPRLVPTDNIEIHFATFDAYRAFQFVNRHLDEMDAAGDRFAELCDSMDFKSARVHAIALGYLHELLKRALVPVPTVQELLLEARDARDDLRARLTELDRKREHSYGLPVRKRGMAARDVAGELLDLAAHGHDARRRDGVDSAPLFGALFVARLMAEQLLTALGDLDAPPLIREVRNEQREACKVAIAHWRALREKVRPVCAGADEFACLAPWL